MVCPLVVALAQASLRARPTAAVAPSQPRPLSHGLSGSAGLQEETRRLMSRNTLYV